MGGLGIAKPRCNQDNRPEMIATLLATANEAAQMARRLPPTDDIWVRVLQIIFSTIFSVILVWVVIKIWKGEWWNDDESKKDE